ncbi:MAG: histidinol-phosphatase HisJ family protein [Candidatus Thorarchaeota archaeon]|nr:MAG: hypothetical protein DRO87_01900 [Candidatus Thorarchaeota archaeon]
MIDYHIHPDYSLDAEGSVDMHCRAALEAGLKEIVFTTHLDADRIGDDHWFRVRGKRVDVTDLCALQDYETTVRDAGDRYSEDGLTVLLGIEVDYYEGVEGDLPEQFYSTDFDIILGSVHMIDHVAISAGDRASAIFDRYTLDDLGRTYFNTLFDAIDADLFDMLAHLDLYRRFGERYYGEDARHLWKSYLDGLADRMKRKRVGFEINTSPWRRGGNESMPSRELTKALFDTGIRSVTVGSDAHTPKNIGADIGRALRMLKDIGFNEVMRFRRRKKRPASIHELL